MLRYGDVPDAFNLATHFVDRHLAEGRGGRTALIAESGPCTYAQLAERVNRIAHVLRDAGVRAEERVMLALCDSVDFVATWYAAQKIAAVTAEVYTFLPAKDYAYYLRYTRARVVVADATTLDRVREAASASVWLRLILVSGVPAGLLRAGEASLDDLAAAAPDVLEPVATTKDEIALWKYTTGSTGAPKACVHPQATPLLSWSAYADGVLGMTQDDVVLGVPKLFFGYARDLVALYPFGPGGAGIVFPQRATAERIFALIARHRPTVLVNVPTMIRAMVEHPEAGAQDLSCLRLCTSAGEALPAELHERWLATFGVEILDGIGSSEAYHIYISNRPGRVRVGTVGEVVPGYRARIVDDAGAELPDGQTGRLWIEGDTTALMYWNARQKSLEAYAGRLVMSGDLFERSADGYYTYRGRADDLLKVGGIWVAPTEVESCLLDHPRVSECAVVGYQEAGLDKLRAFVVSTPGPPLEVSALRDHVKATLSPHKAPRDVRLVASLPKTGSGKIDRRALRSA
jgi:benzoate-CoA ligase family protein